MTMESYCVDCIAKEEEILKLKSELKESHKFHQLLSRISEENEDCHNPTEPKRKHTEAETIELPSIGMGDNLQDYQEETSKKIYSNFLLSFSVHIWISSETTIEKTLWKNL
ncbi:uncharacterized protein LOC121767901 isoform X2 [Salvia splendens]|uniref:uncharacterized protein LOC121767901 isoform X2 n=1 Tax=Salvia splendens TaxID=180675 RepID=UPI001C255DFE|nr:uncharacterized protein LOC121767901 isoform X2 [Salvia splendens]